MLVGPDLRQVGELKQRFGPHLGAIVWDRGETLRLRVKQLICGSLNGMRISPCCSHTYPRWRSGWGLEFRDCGAIPRGEGCGEMEGMWGRRLWWEMPLEESGAAMEARSYCWVTRSGWSHYHSLSPPTCQHVQLNNREAGPSNAWCTKLQSRTLARGALLCAWCSEQQRRTAGKPLSAWLCGERLAKEVFWLPAIRG